jgi:phosphatidylglycerol:prolipoprotein diacylglycerol transferase
MLLYVQFPSWLKPEIIPGLPVRWYGLMYILAFATAFLAYRRQVKERNFPMSDDDLSNLFFWGILGLLLGARIFAAIIYYPERRFLFRPWLIFWPFENGTFTGLQGMSYHGGVIGGALAVIIYTKVQKISFREITDMFCASIPLGFTFGRIGNFINAELYGRVTAKPWGMIFPDAKEYLISESWVREVMEKTGMIASGFTVNLPRHPSQLYEAVFEGIVLWALIWFFRNRKPFKGFLMGLYFVGYGVIRFILEYFREPDSHLGYRIEFVKSTLPPAYAHPPLSFTTGQILCFLMIVFGIVWLIICSRLPGKEVTYVYTETEDEKNQADIEENAARKNKLRNLRKKLK